MKYPNAEWVPWAYQGDGGPTYYKAGCKPAAVVLHIMQGYMSTARQWAITGHYGASWHFSVGRDGSVMQHLEFADGGYHAGITDAAAAANPPTWPLWRGAGINVNSYTIGIEHEGFSGTQFTPEQAAASRDLCRWLAAQIGIPLDIEHFTWHGAIDLVNRRDDFNTAELRAQHYAYLFEEDDMADPRVDKLIAALGGEAAVDAWNAKGNSLLLGYGLEQEDQAAIKAAVEKIDQHVAEALPEHTHEPGGVVRS